MYAEKAYELAKKAHAGQVDKAGNDYIDHPCAVAAMVSSDTDKAVAYLHDVVEDTDFTLRDLSNLFPSKIVSAIDAITKRKGESYDDYLLRVSQNSIAKRVKVADMKHNSLVSRFSNPTEADYKRANRYKDKLNQLLNI